MIVDLERTTTSAISKQLVDLRDEGGVIALGRVLTLIIHAQMGEEEDAIAAANDASREHPMRVLVVSRNTDAIADEEQPRLDAQIRVGGDAGASEVIVLKCWGEVGQHVLGVVQGLLLSDAPVVAWWPTFMPETPSRSQLGKIAQRRITDMARQPNPRETLLALAACYSPGDSDLAWTRLTGWRAQLAAVLDLPPFEPVESATVHGEYENPSVHLLKAWLQQQLEIDVAIQDVGDKPCGTSGIDKVELNREGGVTLLERDTESVAVLRQPGQPEHRIAITKRGLREQLAEELRRLDPDEMYHRVLRTLASTVEPAGSTNSKEQ
ncbi:glucose-6-phosphate dehydrogenase assembly protein OpcA [Humidisolicoccus flavus]|uniref:glucose-6-phosphate dehydrogenase assembly protein OpcA n=1 Tax=Humidisolicoccus flavus TaxID=3111414 RepID=UPI00324B7C45